MIARAPKERANFGRQLALGLTFFAKAGILPDAAEAPALGAVAGMEAAELIQTKNVTALDTSAEVAGASCIETGAICVLIGGSFATAAPFFFMLGLSIKAILSAKRAHFDPENRAFYAADAALNLTQVATVGVGWAGGVEKKVNLAIAGTASLLSSVKSLVFSAKTPSAAERELEGTSYVAISGEAAAISGHAHAEHPAHTQVTLQH